MIVRNIKMEVTPEQSQKIQEICFKHNIYWTPNIEKKIKRDGSFLCIFKDGSLGWGWKGSLIDPEIFIRTNGSCSDDKKLTFNSEFQKFLYLLSGEPELNLDLLKTLKAEVKQEIKRLKKDSK